MIASVLLALALVFVPAPAGAQQGVKPWKVGYLSAGFPRPDLEQAFRRGLRELGYAEGRDFVLESRWAEGKSERLPQFAVELVKLRPDVVVAIAVGEIEAVQRATSTIPIVMILTADPVGPGIVKSLARPGGNVTGLTSTTGPEILGKRLELLRELVPAPPGSRY